MRLIYASGLRVITALEAVEGLLGSLPNNAVVLTCDDGGDFDYFDLPHPTAGTQTSVINRLREFAIEFGKPAHITSFVIVSPEARGQLDRSCMIGRGWWTDGWWAAAAQSGLMHIGNHSWDHNHDALPPHFKSDETPRGTFLTIDSRALADQQIRVASEYLAKVAPNPGAQLFAYPYGESNDFLRRVYFPTYGSEIGITAAFETSPEYLTQASSRWALPRFVFGRDWCDPNGLSRILADAAI